MPEQMRFDERARGGNLLAGVLARLAVTVPLILVGGLLFLAVAFGAPGWLIWVLLAAFVVGFVAPFWMLVRLRRQVGVLVLSPDAVVRTAAGERLEVGWDQVSLLTVVPNYLTAEPLLVLCTEPSDALLPATGRFPGRLNSRLYGGAVVVPLSAVSYTHLRAHET